MSRRLTLLSVLVLLSLQSISLSQALPLYIADYELPEIDGSAVGDCRFLPMSTTDPVTEPPPITKKQEVVTAKKPIIKTTPKKPKTKDVKPPIRPQPAPKRPITNNHLAADLLRYLMTVSRASSDSDESAEKMLRRAVATRRNVGSFSSDDSSDES